jgi:hypothetical protein
MYPSSHLTATVILTLYSDSSLKDTVMSALGTTLETPLCIGLAGKLQTQDTPKPHVLHSLVYPHITYAAYLHFYPYVFIQTISTLPKLKHQGCSWIPDPLKVIFKIYFLTKKTCADSVQLYYAMCSYSLFLKVSLSLRINLLFSSNISWLFSAAKLLPPCLPLPTSNSTRFHFPLSV